jgi:hypothetical protein
LRCLSVIGLDDNSIRAVSVSTEAVPPDISPIY